MPLTPLEQIKTEFFLLLVVVSYEMQKPKSVDILFSKQLTEACFRVYFGGFTLGARIYTPIYGPTRLDFP